jgi:predicted nuclease with TOPRIM domain
LRDIEFRVNRLGRVLYCLSKGHYTFQKIFSLVQSNNALTEVMINSYDDMTGAVIDIQKDRMNIGQHDIKIEPGSTLPESKWATYGVYLEAFQMGLVDRMEVLKKNPEIFDKEGVMQRLNEVEQYKAQVEQLQTQLQGLSQELESAKKESSSDKQRVQIEKFKSRLSEIEARMDSDRRVNRAKFNNAVLRETDKLKRVSDEMANVEGA